jgi:hypothetical protein
MRLTHLLKTNHVSFLRSPGSVEIRLECPQCAEEGLKVANPRLFFNLRKKVGQCFRCGWHGKESDLTQLLNLKDPRTLTYPFDDPKPTLPLKRLCPLPAEATPAHTHPRARRYLKSRGLSVSDMQQFALLYCPRGETYWEDRIIVPVFDRRANYRTFVSRAINPLALKKYLYPKGSSMGSLLYNLHFQPPGATVWITEGVFDALHCFPHAVATFGKHLSEAQLVLLLMHRVSSVVLLWDAEAWQNTPELWERALSKLRKFFFTFALKLPSDTPTEYSLRDLEKMVQKARRL